MSNLIHISEQDNIFHKILRSLILILAVAAFLVVWFRAPYGVEVTDEAHSIVEPYLVSLGSVPYVDMPSQTPLTSLLIAPFITLFTALTGGTEGIFLYMLRVAVIVRAAIAVGVWALLRRRMGEYSSAVCALLLFLCDMGHTRPLNYNNLSLYLLALSGALLYNALGQEVVKKAALRYMAAGVTMALCAMAHVTQIINCLVLAVVVLLWERRRIGRIPVWLCYALGGIAIAVLVVLGLELASGWRLFSGLLSSLALNNYYRIPKLGIAVQLHRFWSDLYHGRLWLSAFIPLFPAVLVCVYLLLVRSDRKQQCLRAVVLSSLGAYCAYLLWLALRFQDQFSSDYAAFLLFLSAPFYLFLLPRAKRRQAGELLSLFWLPCLISVLTVAVASHSPANYRYYALQMGAVTTVLFLSDLIHDLFPRESFRFSWMYRPVSILPLCIAGLFSASMITNLYTNTYREEPIPQQTFKMESGVFAGCYTTPDRGERITALEQQLRQLLSAEDTVLFSELMPMAYLMTDAQPLTPTGWDPNMYRYGFQDNHLLGQWYAARGQYPDKIIFVNSEGKTSAVDDPENEFGAFVRENYEETARFGEGLFSMRVYEHRTSHE